MWNVMFDGHVTATIITDRQKEREMSHLWRAFAAPHNIFEMFLAYQFWICQCSLGKGQRNTFFVYLMRNIFALNHQKQQNIKTLNIVSISNINMCLPFEASTEHFTAFTFSFSFPVPQSLSLYQLLAYMQQRLCYTTSENTAKIINAGYTMAKPFSFVMDGKI